MPTALVVPLKIVVRDSLGPPTSKLDEPEASSSASTSEYGLSRRDTEQILDYYQSEDAGRTYNISSKSPYFSESYHQREREAPTSAQSAMRPSSVGRDSNGNPSRTSMESVASSSGGVQRRTSQRSAGGADKRRLAIVELDSQPESQVSSGREQRFDTSNLLTQPSLDLSLLARRGVDSSRLGGLALVGPPDAQSSSFTGTGLSPIPASAPATGIPPAYRETKVDPFQAGHTRSMSDAQSRKKGGIKASPRDIGIVGTLGSINTASHEQTDNSHLECQRPSTSEGSREGGGARSDALTAPVFQTPRSRSPSPLPLTGISPSTNPPASESRVAARGRPVGNGQQLSPSIGQDKDIGRPVSGPIVMDLSAGQPIIGRSTHATRSGSPIKELTTSSSHTYAERDTQRTSGRLPFKPNQTTLSYLHYQPGVHSIAGPLPSPPRHLAHQHSLPPPRPPRALSPPPARRNEVGHAKSSSSTAIPDGSKSVLNASLKLPAPASRAGSDLSISAVSASSSGSDDRSHGTSSSALDESEITSKSTGQHDQTDKTPTRSGNHVREGAFPVSSVFLSSPSQSPPSPSQHQNLDTLVASIGGAHGDDGALSHPQAQPELKREGSWVSLSAESFEGEPDSPPSSYPSSSEEVTRVATATVYQDDVTRKRASLPAPPPSEPPKRAASLLRRPSLLGISRSSRTQASSPSSLPSLPRKTPSSWPDAMNFLDVLAKKTAAERALAYSAKIRELATEETGLTEWLHLNSRKERAPATFPSTAPASRAFTKQSRHLSRNSMASEVTFPIRQDSYTATDLSPRPPTELSSPSSLAVLPYPSLAHGVGVRRRSSRTLTVDSSVASLSGSSRSIGGAFFASIGRKSSVKKDRSLAPVSPTKLLSSRRPPQPPQPRPVKLGVPPTLPGGPRAPARYALRAHSVVFDSPEPLRSEGQSLSMSPHQTVDSTEAFDRQLGKLSDLLPQADKDVLAGYLHRAPNQDPMTAIGSYLDDEKHGNLRHG